MCGKNIDLVWSVLPALEVRPLDWSRCVNSWGEATSMQTKWIKLDLGPAGFVLKSRSIPKLLRLCLITSSVRFRTLSNGGLTVCTITPAIPHSYSLYFLFIFCRSHKLLRAFYIPGLSEQHCEYGKYTIYQSRRPPPKAAKSPPTAAND